MSPNSTNTIGLRDQVYASFLEQLPRARLDPLAIEASLAEGLDPRIPSRKAIAIIARVCKALGVGVNAVKKSDLRPEQVTSVRNLIDLLTRRIGDALDSQ
jgi:K+-transporting ATPase c subunit